MLYEEYQIKLTLADIMGAKKSTKLCLNYYDMDSDPGMAVRRENLGKLCKEPDSDRYVFSTVETTYAFIFE